MLAFLLLTSLAAADTRLPAPRPWKPPEVKLVSAGAEPRALLRYALKVGRTQHAELTGSGEWRMGPKGNTVGRPLPAVSTPFDLVVDSSSQWSFTFATASAHMANGEPDISGAAAVLQSVDGVTGKVTFDDRGLAQQLSVFPSSKDAQHQSDVTKLAVGSYYAMEMARTTFMHLMTPLPLEPVGVGATWQVERPQSRGSLTYTEVVTFTLVAREPHAVKLTARLGGKPDPFGPIRADQLELNVGGDAECHLDLTAPLATLWDEHLTLHAIIGAKEAQRSEHEGALASHLTLTDNRHP